MTGGPVVKRRTVDIQGENWNTREDRIRLPSSIAELGIGPGDVLHIELLKEEYENSTLTYIYGKKSEKLGTTTEGYYKVHGDGRITYPEWMKKFFSNPDEQFTLEINLGDDPHFRFYNSIDYDLRMQELREQGYDIEGAPPIVLPLIWTESGADCLDVASQTQYSGQRFRLLPFNANDSVFGEESSSHQLYHQGVLKRVVETGSLPQTSAASLRIQWYPEGETENEEHGQSYILYEGTEIDELRVSFPERGVFKISWQNSVSKQSRGGWVMLSHGAALDDSEPISENWYGSHYSTQGDGGEITVYIPYKP